MIDLNRGKICGRVVTFPAWVSQGLRVRDWYWAVALTFHVLRMVRLGKLFLDLFAHDYPGFVRKERSREKRTCKGFEVPTRLLIRGIGLSISLREPASSLPRFLPWFSSFENLFSLPCMREGFLSLSSKRFRAIWTRG
jgi:hypothetical protein